MFAVVASHQFGSFFAAGYALHSQLQVAHSSISCQALAVMNNVFTLDGFMDQFTNFDGTASVMGACGV